MSAPPAGYPPEKIIFLLGIMPRSGTNYLFDLLLAHPGCTASRIPEDYFVAHADQLDGFVQRVARTLQARWGPDEAGLYAGLRRGLVSLLAGMEEERRIIAKTPSVANLERFFKLFPTSQLIILMRDGRAVVESGLRSFGDWSFEEATREWATAARQIARFQAAERARQHLFAVVRYEDLYTQLRPELKRLYEFLGLDPAGVNFDALEIIPVRGSSVHRGEGNPRVHWQPVARTADFDPLQRFAGWKPAQHARFNWLAGDSLRLFGYEPTPVGGAPAYWQIYNRGLDARYAARHGRQALGRRLQRLRRR
jgi:hypothetical protein